MKRQIKFRAWSPKHKKYLYPYPEAFWIIGENTVFDVLKQSDHNLIEYNDICIEQFTNRIDKNKKEIYDGDICKIDWKDSRYGILISQVSWNDKINEWDFGGGLQSEVHWSHEVIGNIRTNPELINNEK